MLPPGATLRQLTRSEQLRAQLGLVLRHARIASYVQSLWLAVQYRAMLSNIQYLVISRVQSGVIKAHHRCIRVAQDMDFEMVWVAGCVSLLKNGPYPLLAIHSCRV